MASRRRCAPWWIPCWPNPGRTSPPVRSIGSAAVAVLPLALGIACGAGPAPGDGPPDSEAGSTPAPAALPRPSFHHIHVNSVDPARSLDWWATLWPAGERTAVAGLPAFEADGVYLLYNQVETRAPGAFNPARRQSVPQSAFWTTGPSTDGLALYERLTALDPAGERFGLPAGLHRAGRHRGRAALGPRALRRPAPDRGGDGGARRTGGSGPAA